MANGSTRGILIATNTDMESPVAYYNEESGVDDTNPDKGIFYKYPVDGTNQMLKISAGKEAATPGAVSPHRYLQKRYKFLRYHQHQRLKM